MKCSANKFLRFDYRQDIVVLVGKDETRFVVHQNLICERSDFFRAACEGDWRESSEKVVRLPEADIEPFSIYVAWLYTSNVDASSELLINQGPKYVTALDNTDRELILERLTDAYLLGDMLQDVKFRNALVDEVMALVEALKWLPDVEALEDTWDRLPHGSTMAKLWVDYVASDCKEETFEQNSLRYPASFVREIAIICIREQKMKLSGRKPYNRARCYYHEHKEAKDKCE